jgi:plastocyanin
MMRRDPVIQGRTGLGNATRVLGGLLFSVILITLVSGCAVFFGHRHYARGERPERYHNDHYYDRHRDQYGERHYDRHEGRNQERHQEGDRDRHEERDRDRNGDQHRDRYDEQHRDGYVEDHRDGGAPAVAADPPEAVVMTEQLRYDPAQVMIMDGGTVVWKNPSNLVQNVTDDPRLAISGRDVQLPEGVQPFDSGNIGPGGSYSHTFDVPGTYKYFCSFHEAMGMTGEIIVEPVRRK